MNNKKKIRKITEPLVYVLLVAAFGFITTVVNHTGKENQVRDTEFVSYTLENQIEALFNQEETGVSL